jgi:hypothetical protein
VHKITLRLSFSGSRAATAFYSAAVTQAKAAGVIFQTIIKRGPSLSLIFFAR